MNAFTIWEAKGKRQETREGCACSVRFRFALLVSLVSLLVFSLPVLADPLGKILIEIDRTAEVTGPVIYLADISKITAPDFFKEELARIDLGKSPRAGRMKQLAGDRIAAAVNATGLGNKDMINIQVPDRVFVKRSSQELDPAGVETVLEQFLSDFFPQDGFRVKNVSVRGIEPYPLGELSLVFDNRYTPSGNGRLSVHADVWVDGVKEDRVTITGTLSQFKPVVVAAKRLEKGQAITPADVILRDMDVFGLQPDVMTSVDQVSGMVMVRTIDKGECLTRDQFKQAPVIEKGAVIKLVAKKNRLSIVTLGVCKEDGYPGQSVTVENLSSGKLVRGIVSADGTVEVVF